MKLVLGYDGSDSSKKALSMVQKYAKVFNATVYAIASLIGEKAIDDTVSWKTSNEEVDFVKRMEAQLEFAKKALEKDGIACETHLIIRGMVPGEDLVKYAKEIDADFIVMGVGKTSRVGKLFFGSNAQYTILEASCPVITVK
jgi:nucleotide-binding universal stress UspA family protein